MRKNIGVEPYHYRKIPLLAQTPVEDRLGFRLRLLPQTSKDSEQVLFVLTSLLLSCFILLIPKIVLFGPIHYVPVPNFNSKKGCVASQTSTIHKVLHESNFTVRTYWRQMLPNIKKVHSEVTN